MPSPGGVFVDACRGVSASWATVSPREPGEREVFRSSQFRTCCDVFVQVPLAYSPGSTYLVSAAIVRVYVSHADSPRILVAAHHVKAGTSGLIAAVRGGGEYSVTVQGIHQGNELEEMRINVAAYGLEGGAARPSNARVLLDAEWQPRVSYVEHDITPGALQGDAIDGTRHILQASGTVVSGAPVWIQLWSRNGPEDAGELGGMHDMLDEVAVGANGGGFVFDFRDVTENGADGMYAPNGFIIAASAYPGSWQAALGSAFTWTGQSREVAWDPNRATPSTPQT